MPDEMTVDRFLDLALALIKIASVNVAHKLDFFSLIERGNRNADSVAQAAGADPRATAIILRILERMEILKNGEEGYELTEFAQGPLTKGGLGKVFGVFTNSYIQRALLDPAQVLKTGMPAQASARIPDHPFWLEFGGMDPVATPASEEMSKFLAPWVKSLSSLEVLDAGCNRGQYGAAFAANYPNQTHVTFSDWPTVLMTTRLYVEGDLKIPGDRVRYLPGDIFQVPLGGPYGLIIASALFHHFREDECVKLLKRFVHVLKKGGRIVIQDFMEMKEEDKHSLHNKMADYMSGLMLFWAGGEAHSLETYQKILKSVGFNFVDQYNSKVWPARCIVAEKPR